ncbi:hypothetical protein [Rhizobium sp. PP-CC-3G-465]|uniref:hypothetical protein n=1 Tax=Rhizobium sp. PP-CC-3G-465 TaxID=2135648 RepID=UPI00104F6CA4|nr:hypothetical protein C8J33_11231 [Rhizobium sp. PP-CC-3G-465]
MKPSLFWAIVLGCMALGGIAGVLTRPVVLGVPVPLDVLFSQSPLDAPFRDELASHLAMTIAAGAILAALFLFAVTYISNSRTTRL